MTREERKKQMLKFIQNRKIKVAPQKKEDTLLNENRRDIVPDINREEKPKESDKTYINGSSRRKKRREKLLENSSPKEDKRKELALAALENKRKRIEEKRRRREEKIAFKKAEAGRREEERNRRKLEALKKREEKLAGKKQAVKESPANAGQTPAPQVKPAVNTNKKKEDLIALLNARKEKQVLEYSQRVLKKQAIFAEKKIAATRIKEEKVLKKAEILKRKTEDSVARRTAQSVPPAILPAVNKPPVYNKKKEELLEFIRERKLINEQRRTGKLLRKEGAAKKPEAVQEKLMPAVPVIIPAVPIDKKLAAQIAPLTGEARRINTAVAGEAVTKSADSANKFMAGFRKKAAAPAKKEVSAALAKKSVAKYREPFLLVPFMRRHAFKFILFILLIAWFGEMFLLARRFKNPQARLAEIVGAEASAAGTATEEGVEPGAGVAPGEGVGPGAVVEPGAGAAPGEGAVPGGTGVEPGTGAGAITLPARASLSFEKPERIEIEGKRDPFSPGRLTMEVLDKPSPTSIVLAPKPEVVSILRPRLVSIVKEDKRMTAEKLPAVSSSQPPSYQTILKSPALSESANALEKTVKPEVSALIIPEKRCDLIYRGRILIQGVEYLFIEGKQRTYRVTIGDVAEGYRILKKEAGKIYLSKEGILYEINMD